MLKFGFGIGMINIFLWLFFIVAWIYSFVLFVKLAHRGIRAFDIYIGRNRMD